LTRCTHTAYYYYYWDRTQSTA